MRIELPRTLKDYSLTQIVSLIDYIGSKKPQHPLEEKCGWISAVTGIPIENVMRINAEQVHKMYCIIQNHISFKPKNPPKYVKIKDRLYYFEQNISSRKWSAGRLIDADVRSVEIKEKPEYICAICYVENGKEYGEVPLDERAAIMKEGFNGEDFFNLQGFFLRKFFLLSPGFQILMIAKTELHRKEMLEIMRNNG